MDDTTQQNAALVEQAAAAAQSMQDQALVLMQAVDRFRLDIPSTVTLRPDGQAVQRDLALPSVQRPALRLT